jgi:predicted DNA-binding transcriptional regulator AlpA
MDQLLNPKELASILNVKAGTVYSWLSRGVELPASIRIGGCTRWREKTVLSWIEAKEKERKRKNFED